MLSRLCSTRCQADSWLLRWDGKETSSAHTRCVAGAAPATATVLDPWMDVFGNGDAIWGWDVTWRD